MVILIVYRLRDEKDVKNVCVELVMLVFNCLGAVDLL